MEAGTNQRFSFPGLDPGSQSSDSAGSTIDSATSASTDTFVTALVFNLAVFGIELAAFTLVRPYFPAIYQPRTYIVPEQRRIKPLASNIITWPWAVFRSDFHDIKAANGLDAYFFVRFLRMIVRVLLPIWLISWAVLLPITSVNTTVEGHAGLDKFSFGNVAKDKTARYAAHLVLAWFSTFWLWYNIKREMAHFITTRQRWLIDPKNATSAQAHTVLLTGVPQRYLTESAISKLFEELPGGVRKVWLNRDLKEMPELHERRLKACAKLESAETALLNTAAKLHNKKVKADAKAAKKSGKQAPPSDEAVNDGQPLTAPSVVDTERGDIPLAERLVPKDKRPSHRLPPFSFLPFGLPLMGQKVDTIDWAREEIAETSKLLKECRRTLARDVASSSSVAVVETNEPDSLKPESSSQTYPPLNSAFVLFNRQIAAHLAAQALTHHEPYRMAVKFTNVAPEDIIWANLNMNPYEARVRSAIGWGMTLGLIILWAFPVAFVGVVSNIHSLCATYSWLAWICKLPGVIVGIISGILPPVLLAVLMMLLPIVLRLLARFEGTQQRTGLELSLMTRYFLFQVLHSFLIVTLSSGIIAALPGLVNNPASIPTLLAQNLPKASNFFLTYVVLQGLSGTAAGFLQVVPLILYYVKLFILGSTPRSIYGIKYTGRSVAWGTLWPATTLLVVITLAYSIISPIINGLACATFFLFYQLWKYLFLWQLDQPRSGETGGLFFPKAIQHVFVGMYIQQVCLAALFFLAQNDQDHPAAIPEGALMIVLIVFTAFFHIIINNSYGPLIHSLPLTLADKSFGSLPDENREEAERKLSQQASIEETKSKPEKKPPVADTDLEVGTGASTSPNPAVDTRKSDKATVEHVPGSSEADAVSSRHSKTSDPPSIKALDEEAGPKEFYHPASVEPQRIIWLPKDQLGLAEAEVHAIREKGIEVSTENAKMNGKGQVDISGAPPGLNVE
ncbi:hypothetical protein QCA50_019680 [Cerrena zonata]|uniref:DUF221-domain-containing protein n=1 Tax=Cerrena zonata TaxID=2478898 RepID=A0AAW0FKY7_9APHY